MICISITGMSDSTNRIYASVDAGTMGKVMSVTGPREVVLATITEYVRGLTTGAINASA